MKGLFLNGFYSSLGNIKLFLLIVTAAAAVVTITGNPTAQELFVYLAVTAFSVNAVVSTRKDEDFKWNMFELTLPVSRKHIILCKYVTYFIWVMAGTVLALVVTVITMWIHKGANLPYGVENLYSIFVLGIGISLLTGALFYPVSYLVGIEKSETILIISILAAIGLVITALNVLNLYITSFTLRMTVFAAFYLIVFGGSYRVTRGLYLNMEFK